MATLRERAAAALAETRAREREEAAEPERVEAEEDAKARLERASFLRQLLAQELGVEVGKIETDEVDVDGLRLGYGYHFFAGRRELSLELIRQCPVCKKQVSSGFRGLLGLAMLLEHPAHNEADCIAVGSLLEPIGQWNPPVTAGESQATPTPPVAPEPTPAEKLIQALREFIELTYVVPF